MQNNITPEQEKESLERLNKANLEIQAICEKYECALLSKAGIVAGKIVSAPVLEDMKYLKKPESALETGSEETPANVSGLQENA